MSNNNKSNAKTFRREQRVELGGLCLNNQEQYLRLKQGPKTEKLGLNDRRSTHLFNPVTKEHESKLQYLDDSQNEL